MLDVCQLFLNTFYVNRYLRGSNKVNRDVVSMLNLLLPLRQLLT
jgi:hypothetical protein